MNRKDWLWLAMAGLLFQGLWLLLLPHPAYMDAYYYTSNGQRLAEGQGWTEMVVWQYLDDPQGVPTPSHTYWMPLPSLLAAAGYTLLPTFRGAQLPFWLMTGLLPLLSYALSAQMGGKRWQNIAAALLTLTGGFYLGNWNQPETFAPFAWAGGGCLFLLAWAGKKSTVSSEQLAVGIEQSPVHNSQSTIHHSQFSQFSTLSPQSSLLIYALVGALAGLAHLTRADGLLLLVVALIVVVWPVKKRGEATGRPDPRDPATPTPVAPPLRPTHHASRILALILGYLLIMIPWFWHNIRVTGSLLPTVGTQTMFLTTYDDLFAYGRAFDLGSFLDWGLGNIVRSKVNGVWHGIQTWIAVCGLVFLAPFIGLGGWVRWREGKEAWSRPHLLYALFLFAAMSLVFTFPGERGGLFHSSVALWPWFMALAPVGIGWSVDGLARRLPHWQPEQAKRLFTGLFIAVALLMSAILGLTRGSFDLTATFYAEVAETLPDGAAAMVGNAPAFYYHTGHPAYSLPNEPLEIVLDAAARYQISYIILDENHPIPLANLYNESQHPALKLVATVDTIKVFRVISNQ